MTDWLGLGLTVLGMLIAIPVAGFRWLSGRLNAIDGKLDKQGERLTKVEQQVTPNHGSSLRDTVDRIEDMAREMQGSYQQHLKDSAYDLDRTDRAIQALSNQLRN